MIRSIQTTQTDHSFEHLNKEVDFSKPGTLTRERTAITSWLSRLFGFSRIRSSMVKIGVSPRSSDRPSFCIHTRTLMFEKRNNERRGRTRCGHSSSYKWDCFKRAADKSVPLPFLPPYDFAGKKSRAHAEADGWYWATREFYSMIFLQVRTRTKPLEAMLNIIESEVVLNFWGSCVIRGLQVTSDHLGPCSSVQFVK